MTAWGETNRDALTLAPDEVSRGKRLGFLEAYDAAWQEQFSYLSQWGAEYELMNMEEENLQRARSVGAAVNVGRLKDDYPEADIRNIGMLPDADKLPQGRDGQPTQWKPYTETMRSLIDGAPLPKGAAARDKELQKLKEQFPDAGIMTYADMYGAVRAKSDRARMRASRDTSWAGTVGWFIGGMVGGLDPRTNPINFLALPVGGVGSSATSRIATQGAGQGLAETVAQFTGARENQRLLGGDPTATDTALAIGGAAVGGAAIQGVGEGLGWAARRWFRNTPDDPAPPAPEAPKADPAPSVKTVDQAEAQLAQRMKPTLEGEAAITKAVRESIGKGSSTLRGARSDFFHMREQLSRFDGPQPWEVTPPTNTRLPTDVADVSVPRFEPKSPGETLDDIARRIDAETFRVYDNLQKRIGQARALVEHHRALRDIEVDKSTAELRAEISKLEAKLKDANKRQTKKINEKLPELKKQLADTEGRAKATDSEAMATNRSEVMRIDEKMRDLAPAVSRAYSRAQGKWEVQQQTLKDVQKMISEGRQELQPTPSPVIDKAEAVVFSKPTVADSAPELRSTLAKPVTEGTDAIDEVQRVAKEILKQSDEQLEKLRTDIGKLIKGEGDEAVIQLEGYKEPIKLSETIVTEAEDGTVRELTVRELLESIDEDAEVLKAVGTCSVGVTSATA